MRPVFLNCLLFVVIFSTAGIYHWINRRDEWDSMQSHRSIRFVLDNKTGEIVLQDDQLITWLKERDNQTRICSVVHEVFCRIHTKTGSVPSECDPTKSSHSNPENGCLLNLMSSLGPFPSVTSVNVNESRIPDRPGTYSPSMIYALQSNQKAVQLPCKVNSDKRKTEYRLLRHWVHLAEKNGLIWWLNYGSLLGAVRDGDFIPYDHDTDIAVLDSAEPHIRRLETPREKITFDEISLVTRKQNYCSYDHMPRINCQGVPVRFQLDPCGFCTPLARLISGYFDFLDLFMVRIEVRLTSDGTSTRIGVVDEGSGKNDGFQLSYALDDIFPLTTCQYMGLSLPCPRNPQAVLSHVYGENYQQPDNLCNLETGRWSSGQ
ncbi:hypothetical protein FBUS_09191 [Fasciolopsis buskii]|uniref:LicD/FKTN/FKRP nucleotidyltransferase domain-containing protein n=1 Tax=Fasciolopsis buskii TaxID=27845 RepID=A0A8E0VIB0_9TREM|nr:hypothetical protein FBUS_09191 [Fasciolopsis buski]